jgi:hypothetical protein
MVYDVLKDALRRRYSVQSVNGDAEDEQTPINGTEA